MAKNNFVMNFYGPVGEHIDTVKEMTVNIVGGDVIDQLIKLEP